MIGNTLVPGNACEVELARMMKQYGGMLVGTCTMLLGDADLAQDAVQETFIKAYHKLESFRSEFEGSERAWLTRIAINVCRDHQRTRWFRFVDRKTQLDSLILPAPEVGESAWDLYRAVQSLPKRYGEVILLHYYQDMPVREMADVLGQSESSIYRKLEKARQMLKKTLERWEFNG